jgi:hypothetical protein
MHPQMNPLRRHPVSIAIVLAALAAVMAIFTLVRPEFQRKSEVRMINLAEQETISPTGVRTAFAAEGLRLRYGYDWEFGVVLSNVPSAEQGRRTGVQVIVGGRTGNVDFGPKLSSYDARFENLLVTYDGTDAPTLDRIKAAVRTLAR